MTTSSITSKITSMKSVLFKISFIFYTLLLCSVFKSPIYAATPTTPICISEQERVNDPAFNPFSIHNLIDGGYQNTFNTNKPLDENRPRLCTLTGISGGCPPSTLHAYTFSTNNGENTENWGGTQAVGLGVSNGQNIYVPSSGNNIDQNAAVLVSNLNVEQGTISLQYTLDAGFSDADGNPVNRYDLHLSGLTFNQDLIATWDASRNGSGELPALPAFYNLGTTNSTELIISMADTGSFMNLLEANDFWIGDGAFNPAQIQAFLLKYICPQSNAEIGPTCSKPLSAGDSGSCVLGCSGTGLTRNTGLLETIAGAIYDIFVSEYRILVKYTELVGSGNPLNNSAVKSSLSNSTSIITGSDTKKINDLSFYTDWGENVKKEDEGKYPPVHMNNLLGMVTPEDSNINTIRTGFVETTNTPTKVYIFIEDASQYAFGATGYVPNSKELAALGIRILKPSNCSDVCYVPEITYFPPGTNGTNPLGGGDHHIFLTDPNTYVTSVDGTVNPEHTHTDNYPMYASGGYVVGGGDNYATVVNLGMKAVTEDGQLAGAEHASYNIVYKKMDVNEYFANLEYQGAGEGQLVEGGGPIITAQHIYGDYVAACFKAQTMLGTPETIISTAGNNFTGIKRNLFSKQVTQERLAYETEKKQEYLSMNLSEDEKYRVQMEKLLSGGYSHALQTKENTAAIVSKNSEVKSNIQLLTNTNEMTTQTIASGGYQTDLVCPNSKKSSSNLSCSPDTSEKPETMIVVNSKKIPVKCTEKSCDASAFSKDHRIIVKEDFVGPCLDIRAPDGVCAPYSDVNTSKLFKGDSNNGEFGKVGIEFGKVDCENALINAYVLTPLETQEDKLNKKETVNLVAAKKSCGLVAEQGLETAFTSFNSDCEGTSEPVKKEEAGTFVKCQGLFQLSSVTPEDKEGLRYLDKVAKECLPTYE